MVLDKSNREDFSSDCRKKMHENKRVNIGYLGGIHNQCKHMNVMYLNCRLINEDDHRS